MILRLMRRMLGALRKIPIIDDAVDRAEMRLFDPAMAKIIQDPADPDLHLFRWRRALAGMQPCGKCFGYRDVPFEDPTRSGTYGRSAIIGVRLEIEEEQAQIIGRAFEMYAKANSLSTIAKQRNCETVLALQPPRTRKMRAWSPPAIREMLRNE